MLLPICVEMRRMWVVVVISAVILTVWHLTMADASHKVSELVK